MKSLTNIMSNHNQEPEQLKADYENARIIDYRDPANPNDQVVITCEHATNILPEDYAWNESDKRYFVNEHWGSDIGAFDMANSLAAELKCVFVHTLYSRLLIDTNRSLVADTLFRRAGDGKTVGLNKDMDFDEEQSRIGKYYVSYYEALREISLKINPSYILSIHSFTPNYQGELRPMEIGILCSHDSADFAADLNKGMIEKGYKSEINAPYDGITTMGAVKSLVCGSRCHEPREGITFEFRNDILTNKERCSALKQNTVDVIKTLCDL